MYWNLFNDIECVKHLNEFPPWAYLGRPQSRLHFGITKSIMIMVDRFSKMAYFVPSRMTSNVSYIASLFFKAIVKLHGVYRSLTSDRDVKFIIWERFNNFYSSIPPVTLRLMGNMLRGLASEKPKQWDYVLAQTEFAFNNIVNRWIRKPSFAVIYTRVSYFSSNFTYILIWVNKFLYHWTFTCYCIYYFQTFIS